MKGKEVGKNTKDKNGDKRARDGALSQKGSLKQEVSKHQETLTAESVCLGSTEGNITRWKNK